MDFDDFLASVVVKEGGFFVSCLIQPKASRERLLGIHDQHLKIALTSPPVDGKANAALIKLLSKKLHIAKGKIIIESGQASRRKKVFIAVEWKPEELFNLLKK